MNPSHLTASTTAIAIIIISIIVVIDSAGLRCAKSKG